MTNKAVNSKHILAVLAGAALIASLSVLAGCGSAGAPNDEGFQVNPTPTPTTTPTATPTPSNGPPAPPF